MRISNKVFIITGASSGLGSAAARMVVANGGKVLLADVNEQAGTELASGLGTAARFHHTDVTDEASASAAVAAAQHMGALAGLINCAGVAPAEKVIGKEGPHSLASFARTISINLVGSFNMLRLAAAAIIQEAADDAGERGIIINTASIAAFDGQIAQAAYAASKGGVVAMALPVARELARYGIRVMTIAPGMFETPMMAGMPQEVQDSLTRQVPFPSRFGKAAEYAQLCQAIIENPMLNGEVIRLDGAVRMAAK